MFQPKPASKRGLCRISFAISWLNAASRPLFHQNLVNIKHGQQARDKPAAQRHAAKVGRRVRGELKRFEQQIVDAGLMPDGD